MTLFWPMRYGSWLRLLPVRKPVTLSGKWARRLSRQPAVSCLRSTVGHRSNLMCRCHGPKALQRHKLPETKSTPIDAFMKFVGVIFETDGVNVFGINRCRHELQLGSILNTQSKTLCAYP